MAKVIVLNGVSSAGKSTLAKEIQATSNRDWIHVSLDQFISMLPAGREMAPEWFKIEDLGKSASRPEISLTNGPRGTLLMQSMRDFVRIAADRNLDVIVDDVATLVEVSDYGEQLYNHDLIVVKVDLPLAVAERRERQRGDRMIGLARQQWGRIHEGIQYDLVVQNDDGLADRCAEAILAAVER